ncbi:MAG: sodium:solute symporter, partial [Bacteroidia bacterium]|nr:sodium:solute symporter [Bacteroidia bacterium]
IYTYLERRFGKIAYKTGAFYFLLSRTIGAAFRLYLVAMILQLFVFDAWGMPFWLAVAVTIVFIYIYTFKGGIRTIVWTDTLQTFFMLLALVLSMHFLAKGLKIDIIDIGSTVRNSPLSTIFVWDPMAWNFFWKHFIGGAFITIAMTGLDQDMMQKNLSCKNLPDAQKNMLWFSVLLFFVNILFLAMGTLMYMYMAQEGIAIPEDSDHVFPTLALNHFSQFVGVIFLLGLTAASYSSADSALTALTTSFCIDFLGFEKDENREKHKGIRYKVHIMFSVILFIVIMLFALIKDRALIDQLFIAATYTYGPLLGLFAFGILSRKSIHDKWVLVVCILSPVICYLLKDNSEFLFGDYKFGFEMLLFNGILTYLGLHLISKNNVSKGAID